MKKIYFAFITVLLLAVLVSCSDKTEYPYTSAESKFLFGDTMFYTNSDHLLAYRTADGTENLLCYDPLCTHNSMDCHAYSLGRSDLAAVEGKDGTPIVFYTAEYIDFKSNNREYRLYSFDMASGERNIVLSQNEYINSFALHGSSIYLKLQCTQYDEKGSAVSIGTNFFVIDTDGKNFKQLTFFSDNVVDLVGVVGDRGEERIYWINYADNRSLYVSSADFSGETKLMSNLTLMGNFICDGYLYYSVKTEEMTDALIVPAHPSDRYASSDGTVTVRAEKAKTAYYRLNISEENSTPELIFSGVGEATANSNTLYVHENKAYIIPYEPVYFETIAATMNGQTGDLATDAMGGSLQIDYIVADSGGKILELDLVNGKIKTIETPGYDVKSVIGLQNGILITSSMVTDGDRIRERLNADGVSSNTFSFGEELHIELD